MSNPHCILAIESSCDDTSAAIYKEGKILANVTAGQDVHKAFGGVVPELASRAHMEHIWPLLTETMKQAGLVPTDITHVAFTRGPGLIGSLVVGVNFAKGMALALDVDIVEVNHMQAHVAAHYIDNTDMQFPFLCLTVSGGHSQIVVVRDYLDMEVIGNTLDDAAGEAFDKSAKLFGLPYPGGPMVDKLAKSGNKEAFQFAKPDLSGYDFSFSGLKTSILYFVQKQKQKNEHFVEENMADLCASVQESIVNILLDKLEQAAMDTGITHVGIGGGVAANSRLRARFAELGEKKSWTISIPEFQYCTDNAAMIAAVAYHKINARDFSTMDVDALAKFTF